MKMASERLSRYTPWWKLRSLNAKLLLPIAGLMLTSLLFSTLIFIFATNQSRDQILKQQIDADLTQARTDLSARAAVVPAAAKTLASNPDLITSLAASKSEASLQLVDSRAVLVRERFDIDLVQIYDASGHPWTNLVSSELYQVSSLLSYMPEPGSRLIHVGDHLLLLHRTDASQGTGIVITGLDLGSELRRLAGQSQLNGKITLDIADVQVTSRVNPDTSHNLVALDRDISLAGIPGRLVISRGTAEIDRVAGAGLRLMIFSSLATTLLLVGLMAVTIRQVVAPVQRLAQVSNKIAAQRQLY